MDEQPDKEIHRAQSGRSPLRWGVSCSHVDMFESPTTGILWSFLTFSSVQSLSCARSLQPHKLQHTRPPCPSPTPGVHSKLTSIESVMPSSHLILYHPSPPDPDSTSIRLFSNESTLCMRWPKYWSFSFSIIPSKEHPGLISFRMDWLDLLAV